MLRGRHFFHFSLVPSVFSSCSLYVPNGFPSGPQCVPKHVLPAHLYPICFGKCCHPFTYIGGPRGGTLYFKIEPSTLGSLGSLIFLSDGPIKLACCKWRQARIYARNRGPVVKGWAYGHRIRSSTPHPWDLVGSPQKLNPLQFCWHPV
jgi:hypothetical protein